MGEGFGAKRQNSGISGVKVDLVLQTYLLRKQSGGCDHSRRKVYSCNPHSITPGKPAG
jgi:hypothetical protein